MLDNALFSELTKITKFVINHEGHVLRTETQSRLKENNFIYIFIDNKKLIAIERLLGIYFLLSRAPQIVRFVINVTDKFLNSTKVNPV